MPTNLDFPQVIKAVYNEPDNRLRVEAEITAVIGEIEVELSHTTDSVRLGDGTNFLTSTTVSSKVGLDVNVIGGSITTTNSANGTPGSAAPSQATQVGGSDGTNLRALKVSSTGVLSVDGSATTQPVSGTVTSNFTQSSFSTGSKSSIGTSAVQITASSNVAKIGVTVKAANANTGTVYIGLSGVTAGTTDATDGFELAGGESITIEVDNANKVYVIGSTTGQKVYWTAV